MTPTHQTPKRGGGRKSSKEKPETAGEDSAKYKDLELIIGRASLEMSIFDKNAALSSTASIPMKYDSKTPSSIKKKTEKPKEPSSLSNRKEPNKAEYPSTDQKRGRSRQAVQAASPKK